MYVDELIIYLRKSRADNPEETVEEVLSKHYTILQEFCEREFGSRVPEENIYREVVSGESISDRVEIKKVLTRIEDSYIKGIVVIEPQRLSRGDLIDCGTLINILQYTHTLIITPIMTYNIENKMERRFFQDELLRGRDYLEYTKEILMRGKLASINRGCYLQSIPPYGYDRVKIGKDNTLKPNADADTVKLIFDLYVNQHATTWEIANELQRLGIKSPKGNDKWVPATLDKMLKNYHYIGKVTYQREKTMVSMEGGAKVTKRKKQPVGNFIIAEGKHPAIISEEIFSKAQNRLAERPPVKSDKKLRNAFAGILFCEKCGHVMVYKDRSGERQYLTCKTKGCSKSIKYNLMVETVTKALEQSELPNLIARYNNGEGDRIEIQKKILKNLEKELEEMREQEETQYELLETKKYTQELFDRRNAVLREKMKDVELKIKETKRKMPDAVDYKERIATLEEAIQSLNDINTPEQEKNILLKTIIERIDCNSNQTNHYGEFDFSLKITLRI